MGLDDVVEALCQSYSAGVSAVSGFAGRCYDWLLDFASRWPVFSSVSAGIGSGAAVSWYVDRSFLWPNDSAVFLAFAAVSGLVGTMSYLNLRDLGDLEKCGLDRKVVSYRRFSSFVSERPFLLQLWDAPFDFPGWFSCVAPVAFSLDSGRFSPREFAVTYGCSYLILRLGGMIAHSDSLRSIVMYNLASLAEGFRPGIGLSFLEGLVERFPFTWIKFELMEKYLNCGRVEDAVSISRKVCEQASIDGFVVSRPLRVGFVNDSASVGFSAYAREVNRGGNPEFACLGLASYLSAFGQHERAADVIGRIPVLAASAESSLVAFFFCHKIGYVDESRKHLGEVLRRAFGDGRFSVMHVGEPTLNSVFRIDSPLFRDYFVFKAANGLAGLDFEFGVLARLRGLADASFGVPEPLYSGHAGSWDVLAMSHEKGESLYELLVGGKAGVDSVLSSWVFTDRIHRSLETGISRQGYVRPSEKLFSVLSRGYLGLDEKCIERVMMLSGPAEEVLSGASVVFNTDRHPRNILQAGGKLVFVDFEDKGVVYRVFEAAALARYGDYLSVSQEDEFLSQAGIVPLEFYCAVQLKGVSYLSAWLDPRMPSMHQRAESRVDDVQRSISQLRDRYPLFYARHMQSYEAALGGLEMLRERCMSICSAR
ncbi:hypothetical protein HY640_04560 [Candidatus Woesearchaeota archaeon]|nr:hypothetical protein [Candidatus Woesearchaeota archaeon]